MFWAVIKANLRDPAIEGRFNDWYNRVHVPEYVGQPGFRRGWRTERLERRVMGAEPRPGMADQKFMALYEVDSIEAFDSALKRTSDRGLHAWEEWSAQITDWQRTYYRVLHSLGDKLKSDTDAAGRYWSIVRFDFTAKDAPDERAFNAWYNNVLLPEVCAAPGMRRAFRLQAVPHSNQIGPVDHGHWTVYESDHVDDLPKARKGKTAWDGKWNRQISNWDTLSCRLLCQDLSGPAW